jgi:lysophospholipase L1-like esterase
MSFYFDPLAEILYQKYPGQISLINTGIGGNRVLYDGHFPDVPCDGKCFGEAALTRFERDVYEDDTPDILFIMEGVNDCCHGPSNGYLDEIPTGKEVFDGIMKLSDQAREKGTSVYLCTVLPFNYYESVGSEISEKIRQDLNTLIRNAGNRIAGVVDAEAKVRRPEDPKMIQADLHLGDSLHPNVAGGKIVAEEIAAVLTQEISDKLK